MTDDIPPYCLRAYSLFFTQFGTTKHFSPVQLDFIVSEPMKKKIFSTLLKAGWIRKERRGTYACNKPDYIFKHLLDFKIPQIIKQAKRPYAFTNLSAIEIWSDYSYIQRSITRSPYFIKILKDDIEYWKKFFSSKRIPVYLQKGTSIGEFVILIPVLKLNFEEKDHFFVDTLEETLLQAKQNEMYDYAHEYMGNKYGKASTKRKRNN